MDSPPTSKAAERSQRNSEIKALNITTSVPNAALRYVYVFKLMDNAAVAILALAVSRVRWCACLERLKLFFGGKTECGQVRVWKQGDSGKPFFVSLWFVSSRASDYQFILRSFQVGNSNSGFGNVATGGHDAVRRGMETGLIPGHHAESLFPWLEDCGNVVSEIMI